MKHIQHLEEFVIKSSEFGIFDMSFGCAPFTLKVDGSPAIFFGKANGKFFLSTKSFLNKKRIYWHSIEEAEQYLTDPLLVDKLRPLFKLADCDIKEGEVYMADLLWYPGSYRQFFGTYAFTPNTVEYSLRVGSPDYDAGIALHGKYVWNQEDDSLASVGVGEHPVLSQFVFILPPQTVRFQVSKEFYDALHRARIERIQLESALLSSRDVEQIKTARHVENQIWSYCYKQFIKSEGFDLLRFLKYDGYKMPASVRKETYWAIVSNISTVVNFVESLFDLHNEKLLLLESLSKEEVLLKSDDHEGWVFSSKSGEVVKLVDQAKFTVRNNRVHGRG